MTEERRQSAIRRDLNNLFRDESGDLSGSKIGLLIGQWLSIKLIVQHGSEILANWDSLTVLFMVLIAPDVFRKWLNMKFGGDSTITSSSSSQTTVTKT